MYDAMTLADITAEQVARAIEAHDRDQGGIADALGGWHWEEQAPDYVREGWRGTKRAGFRAALTRWHAELVAADAPRVLQPWTRVDCDRCGCSHMASRTEPRTVAHGVELLCGECQAYEAGERAAETAKTPDDTAPERLRERREALRLERNSRIFSDVAIYEGNIAHVEECPGFNQAGVRLDCCPNTRRRYAAALSAAEAERAAVHVAPNGDVTVDVRSLPPGVLRVEHRGPPAPMVVDVPQPEPWHARLYRRWRDELAAAEPARPEPAEDSPERLPATCGDCKHYDGDRLCNAAAPKRTSTWGGYVPPDYCPLRVLKNANSSPERLRERREALGLSRRDMANLVLHRSICMDNVPEYANCWHPEDVRRCEDVPDAPAIYAQHRARYAAALSAEESRRAKLLTMDQMADALVGSLVAAGECEPEVVDVPQPETWHARLYRLAGEVNAAGKACAEAEAAFTRADAEREKARLARAAARDVCHAKRQALTEATAARAIIDAQQGGRS